MKSILITGLIASSVICNPAQALISTSNHSNSIPAFAGEMNDKKFVQASDNKSQIIVSAKYEKLQKEIAEQKQREERRLEEERKKQEEQLEIQRKASVKFNPYDVTVKSNIKTDELKNVLKHTKGGSGLIPYASYFVEAEHEYGINALFLTGIAAQESGWGSKPAGDGTNLTGHAVYTKSARGTVFEGDNPIRTNILDTAKLIAKDYVKPGAKCWKVSDRNPDKYNGTSIYSINLSYCFYQDQVTVDFRWSEDITTIAKNLEKTYHSIEK